MLSCGHIRNKLEVFGNGLLVPPSAGKECPPEGPPHTSGATVTKGTAGTQAEGTLYPEKTTNSAELREAA